MILHATSGHVSHPCLGVFPCWFRLGPTDRVRPYFSPAQARLLALAIGTLYDGLRIAGQKPPYARATEFCYESRNTVGDIERYDAIIGEPAMPGGPTILIPIGHEDNHEQVRWPWTMAPTERMKFCVVESAGVFSVRTDPGGIPLHEIDTTSGHEAEIACLAANRAVAMAMAALP